jgi:hypothetical protein
VDALRACGYVAALRQAYADWVRRFISFHHVRHRQKMGALEVAAFLDHLAAAPLRPEALPQLPDWRTRPPDRAKPQVADVLLTLKD